MLREEHLTTTRQIVVASRDLGQTDPRFVFARHHWRTDNHLAALGHIATTQNARRAAGRRRRRWSPTFLYAGPKCRPKMYLKSRKNMKFCTCGSAKIIKNR